LKRDLEIKIEELKSYDEKPIGVFGARASGKTMFFTVLYGLTGFRNEDEKFSVICNDSDTHNYLRENYLYLLEGKLPPRTDINEINKVIMRYFYNKSSYDLKSLDFAGELIGTFSHNDEDLVKMFFEKQKSIYKFFANCGGILIFLNPTNDKKDAFERQNEVNNLLGMIQNEKGKWGCDLPIGIVLTKWDKITKELNDDIIQDEEARAEEYIKNHEIYSNIYNQIAGVTEHVKIFPISAFGSYKEGDLPPDDLSNPFNLFQPLVWTSKCRDIVWADRIKYVLNEKINKKQAKSIVDLFLLNVENKELQDEVNHSYKNYLNKKRRKSMAIFAIILALFIGIFSIYLMQLKNYVDINNNTNTEIRIKEIDKFIAKYGSKSPLSIKLISLKKTSLMTQISIETDPSVKLSLINVFIDSYKDDKNSIDEVENIRKQKSSTEKLANNISMQNSIDKEYELLQNRILFVNDDFDKYKEYNSFILKYPDYIKLAEIKSKMKEHLSIAETKLYQDIIKKQNNLSDTNNKSEIFSLIAEFLSVDEFNTYKKEVTSIKNNLDEEFAYNEVLSSIDKYNNNITRETLKEVIRKCQTYLTMNVGNRYQKKILNTLNQIEALESGKNIEFEFYILNKNSKYTNQNLDLIVEIDNKANILERKIGKNNLVYVGSQNFKFNINQKIIVTPYFRDNNDDTPFKSVDFFVEDLEQEIDSTGTKDRSLSIIVKTNKNNLKLK